jgi:hypothetical protein
MLKKAEVLSVSMALFVCCIMAVAGCKKSVVIPFSPLITKTSTPTKTNTPIYSPTITPTNTPTYTATPSLTETLNLSFTTTFTPTVTITPRNGFGGLDADYAYDIASSPDNGYLLAGQTRSFGAGGSDIYLLKINQNGQYQWDVEFGGALNDSAYSIIPCSTGGYLISGFNQSSSVSPNIACAYAMKVDDSGGFLWDVLIPGTDTGIAESIIEAPDKSVYVAGSKRTGNYDFLLFKLDPAGALLWQMTYTLGGFDMCHAMTPNYTGGYLLAGETASYPYYALLDVNSAGVKNWSKIGTTMYTRISSISKTQDGSGYIAAGEQYTYSTNFNLMLIKFDPSGNLLWTRTFGGAAYDTGKSVIALADGYIITGETASFSTDSQIYVVRTDLDGNLMWQSNYGGFDFDSAYSIINGTDNGYVFCGRTFSYGYGSPGDLFVMKIDSTGGISW